jgi:hypothetical protein
MSRSFLAVGEDRRDFYIETLLLISQLPGSPARPQLLCRRPALGTRVFFVPLSLCPQVRARGDTLPQKWSFRKG